MPRSTKRILVWLISILRGLKFWHNFLKCILYAPDICYPRGPQMIQAIVHLYYYWGVVVHLNYHSGVVVHLYHYHHVVVLVYYSLGGANTYVLLLRGSDTCVLLPRGSGTGVLLPPRDSTLVLLLSPLGINTYVSPHGGTYVLLVHSYYPHGGLIRSSSL